MLDVFLIAPSKLPFVYFASKYSAFIEGLHYSIMFYGGRLLSHLTAQDPEVSEFISLRKLNRYISIVIDSDRASQNAKINKTKQRVKKEFDGGPGFSWVTKGREIENYIIPSILEAAVKTVHQNSLGLVATGQYDNPLHFKKKETPKKSSKSRKIIKSKSIITTQKENIDKVKIAYEVIKSSVDLTVLDLKSMVEKLVKFIQDSNDFDE